ncbi:hypothetical protein QFC22_000194 [Naganishia vaughanmartiniae]|uniref:Uncharacterized protein n=1 Tax=Naganishia vaughanmartiniae TaxID=1424756 RepID=A0ACC2XP66_9TREE|nr:hypothetical protein QFC22_000194 [Naganishia vaughanmartiniae]
MVAEMNSEKPILVGVIGGSGLYKLDMEIVTTVNPETPWGFPSSPITIAALPSGTQIAFLARHGVNHSVTPTEVPARANIAALKSLGVQVIVAFSAVGSLREEIAPGDFVIPNSIIDRTKGIRPSTYFQDVGIVAHAMFGDAFDNELLAFIKPLVKKVLDEHPEGSVKMHSEKTVVCMEGPQFSTRAESEMYRTWGGDIINMSVLPEAKLAREAEISYAMICTSTDYDCWRVSEEPVTVAEVVKTLHKNASTSKLITVSILDHLHEAIASQSLKLKAKGNMEYSIITKKEAWPVESKKKLSYILPEYFSS